MNRRKLRSALCSVLLLRTFVHSDQSLNDQTLSFKDYMYDTPVNMYIYLVPHNDSIRTLFAVIRAPSSRSSPSHGFSISVSRWFWKPQEILLMKQRATKIVVMPTSGLLSTFAATWPKKTDLRRWASVSRR